ncbi:MAG: hypothetical protein IPO15_27805 [Anaerolineae bacterium]|uniref:hypothetical protein n=1 Tax=Candidatus Amarolinea dominans TaxID=3140696 RepID=UPI003134E655|nr:hypothetical protein [Anaerolineae bacterium]
MEFTHLLAIVGDEPVFATDLLLAGAVDATMCRRAARLGERSPLPTRAAALRAGVLFSAPGRIPSSANRLVRASHVSQQAALAHYGLIPGSAPVVTSVTTGRPGCWETPSASTSTAM